MIDVARILSGMTPAPIHFAMSKATLDAMKTKVEQGSVPLDYSLSGAVLGAVPIHLDEAVPYGQIEKREGTGPSDDQAPTPVSNA